MAEVINPSAKNAKNQTKSQKRLRLPLGAIKATKKLMVNKAGIMKRNTTLPMLILLKIHMQIYKNQRTF